MNIEQLKKEITSDEGEKLTSYLDHLGFLTVGVGHFVLPSDDIKLDQEISKERSQQLLSIDIEHAIQDCEDIFDDYDDMLEECQHIVINMSFNLGKPRLCKFKNFIAAVNAKDYEKAALEMIDSKWYRQVTNRAQRLVSRMEVL